MKKWAILLGAAAVLGASAAIAVLALRQARLPETGAAVPDIIEDCYTRIQRIEEELSRLKPPGDLTA